MRRAIAAASGSESGCSPAPYSCGDQWVGKLRFMLPSNGISMGTSTPSLELKQDGTKISGTYTGRYGAFPLEGTVAGRALAFSFSMSAEGQSVAMTFQGEVAADALSMKGTATLGEMGEAAWTAKKLQ